MIIIHMDQHLEMGMIYILQVAVNLTQAVIVILITLMVFIIHII